MHKYVWPVLALAGLAAFVAWQGLVPYPDPHTLVGDAYRYVALAVQPFGSSDPLAHEPPFCWRILTPLLVHILPVPTLVGFWLVTTLSLAGATLALMWFLRGLGLSPEATIAGGLAFVCLMPATGFTLYADLLVDPLAFALLALALGCVVHRRGGLLLIALVLMALDKETALFGAAFALAWSWQQKDRLLLRWSLASLVGVLLVLAGLRVLLPSNQPYGLLETLAYWVVVPIAQGSMPERLLLALVGAWGVLLPLAMASPAFWRNRAFWLLWLFATAQVLVSSTIERVMVYAFPVVIAASCDTLASLAKRWNISQWWLWLPVLLLELSWSYTTGPIYPFTITSFHTFFMIGLLVAALVAAGSVWRQQQRQAEQIVPAWSSSLPASQSESHK